MTTRLDFVRNGVDTLFAVAGGVRWRRRAHDAFARDVSACACKYTRVRRTRKNASVDACFSSQLLREKPFVKGLDANLGSKSTFIVLAT